MFVTEETTLEVPLHQAAAGLGQALRSSRFGEVSDHAYTAGLVVMTRVGPLGDVPGLAKTVQVYLSGPRERATGIVYALRWEATGPAGHLFPVLDADLCLTPVEEDRTRLVITACYRPPLGALGAGLDRLLLGRVARATLRSLLDGLAPEVMPSSPADAGYLARAMSGHRERPPGGCGRGYHALPSPAGG